LFKRKYGRFATSTQADFLKQGGIDELAREGTDYWESMKRASDVAAMKMRSRSTNAKLLTDSLELGAFIEVRYEYSYFSKL